MSSYVVLARKWRPQLFGDLTGQEHVARTLQNAIGQGRVPHALLFTGARGVGKTSSARILAMALNCHSVDAPTATPCGECPSCQEIQRGQAVDVLEIDGASNRGINEIRELRDGVRYTPNRDRYKVYIIDEVHMLTTEAFNALLKTLEEPPAHVVFIFATTEAQKIPVTILSRCQRFDFRRIPHGDIVRRISDIATAEGLDVEPAVLSIVARQAAGGMRDALSLLDQVIAFCGTTITLADAEAILGAAERRRLFELSDALVARDVEAALQVVDEVDSFGVDIAHFAVDLVSHLRDLSIVAVSKEPEHLTTLTDGELEQARTQVGKTDIATLHRMFELMVEAGEGIARSNHPRLLFEMALVKLCSLEPAHTLKTLIGRLEAMANGTSMPPPTGAGGTGSGSGGRDAGGSTPPGGRRAAPAVESATAAPVDALAPEPAPVQTAAQPEPAPIQPAPQPAPVQKAAQPEPAPVETAPEPARVQKAAQPEPAPVETAPEPALVETAAEPAPVETAPEPALVRAASGPAPVETAAEPALVRAASGPAPVVETMARDAANATSGEALTEDLWREMVTQMRVEKPHEGELLAKAKAFSSGDGITLAVADALMERVNPDLLTRLNALSVDLAAGDLAFNVVSETTIDASELAGSFHVAGQEEAEARARRAAARNYVETHDATALLMEHFPGSRIKNIEIPDAPTEAHQ